MLQLLISTLTEGFLYALLVYGVYITYRILDFPDLTVDGSFALGAAVTALMISSGLSPFLALPVSLAAGAVAGFVTGLIHVKCRVRDLLSGIITMTALLSVNLLVAGANLSVADKETVFTLLPLGSLALRWRKLIVAAVLALLFKILLDRYFKTRSGLLLRGVGDNPVFVTTLARDSGRVKILGLTLANALVAFCGGMICQSQRGYTSTMGTGQMVFGLAAVLIGTTVFGKISFVRGTTAALAGSVIYKICIQLALQAGLSPKLLNLITAALFLAILLAGTAKKKGGASRGRA